MVATLRGSVCLGHCCAPAGAHSASAVAAEVQPISFSPNLCDAVYAAHEKQPELNIETAHLCAPCNGRIAEHPESVAVRPPEATPSPPHPPCLSKAAVLHCSRGCAARSGHNRRGRLFRDCGERAAPQPAACPACSAAPKAARERPAWVRGVLAWVAQTALGSRYQVELTTIRSIWLFDARTATLT